MSENLIQYIQEYLASTTYAPELLGIEQKQDGNGYLVAIASDTLNLAQKLEVEKAVQHQLTVRLGAESASYTVYFRRKNPRPRSASSRSPASLSGVGSSEGPFGLKLASRKPISGVKNIVLVGSGKGGVGKSTVSINLATACQALGLRAGLLDADIYGPSAPTMLGVQTPPSINAQARINPLQGHDIVFASFGSIMGSEAAAMWRGPMVAKTIRQLLFDVEWGDLDLLIVDLPPGTGDVQIALIENVQVQGAVLVSTPQDVALIDARKAVLMFQRLEIPIFGLIENMSSYSCPNCGHVDPVFGKMGAEIYCHEQGLPFLGRIPLDIQLRLASDQGQPVGGSPGQLGDLFRRFSERLKARLVL